MDLPKLLGADELLAMGIKAEDHGAAQVAMLLAQAQKEILQPVLDRIDALPERIEQVITAALQKIDAMTEFRLAQLNGTMISVTPISATITIPQSGDTK